MQRLKIKLYHLLVWTLVGVFLIPPVQCQSHYPGQHEGKLILEDQARVRVQAFDLEDIRLLESPFRANMLRESKWILSLDVHRLLHSFRTNAGVYNGREGGYMTVDKLGGWESLDCELRGHSTGHILSGLALLFASTGEEIYQLKGDSLVQGLAEVQNVLNQSGYLSAYPQHLIDRNIAGQRVWAPWYTLHKLFAGLVDQYLYADNEEALQVARGMADWAYDKLSALSEEQRKLMIRNEFGGVNDAFYTLYAITGEKRYQWLGAFFYHNDVLDPLREQEDILAKKHANTYIPKLIGLARAYELEGQTDYRDIASFFWHTVVDHHTFVTGSNSDKEKFFEPDQQGAHLSGYTGESCNVYNLLKLTQHLYAFEPSVEYADYYERALYNHILGQQHPETGMIAYFLPMLPGAHKVYSTPEHSFWCCVGTGFENHAKYGAFIYAHSADELYVNLYIPSILNWKDQGLTIRQDTKYPESEDIRLTVTEAAGHKLALKLRYPAWATDGVEIRVNGKRQRIKQGAGSYIVLERKWQAGDEVQLSIPMKLAVQPTQDDASKVALTYGPLVLAGKMGTADMIAPAPYSNPELYNDYYTYDYRVPDDFPHKLQLDPAQLETFIQPLDTNEGLHFKTVVEGYEIIPLYRLHDERMVIYWDLEKIQTRN